MNNPCEKFPINSRQRRICEGDAGIPIGRVNKFREIHGIQSIHEQAEAVPLKERPIASTVVRETATKTERKKGCSSCRKGKKRKPVNKIDFQFSSTKRPSTREIVMPSPGGSKSLVGIPINRERMVCHIIYHIMPLAGEHEAVWKRHAKWLREVRGQFNGRMIIGIVTKNKYDKNDFCSVDDVKNEFDGTRCEFFVTENPSPKSPTSRGAGEGGTFWEMLSSLETEDPDAVIFYGHSKGVTRPAGDFSDAKHRWASVMFDVLFRHKDRVIQSLDTHGMAGLFRRSSKNKYFSGTFFAMRAADVFSRNWNTHGDNYGCVEFWPGMIFNMWSECDCLFGDGTDRLQEDSVWPIIEERLARWKLCGIENKASPTATERPGSANPIVSIDELIFRKSQCDSCSMKSDSTCRVTGQSLLSRGCEVAGKLYEAQESCPAWKWHSIGPCETKKPATTRDLIFHIYPKSNADWNWKWHIEQIRKHASLFNGKICIGIVTGTGLTDPGVVQDLFSGINVNDWVIKENQKEIGETTTFIDLLKCVRTDSPDVAIFRGHTKGSTHSKRSIEQAWAMLMWQTCMDWPSVENALKSHLMAGPMKCHKPLVGNKDGGFFYAGSFYWFRSEIFKRKWDSETKSRWWAEHWPGHICEDKETACLCHDSVKESVIMDKYWGERVSPDWATWERARRK